jgi:hypothetical protein
MADGLFRNESPLEYFKEQVEGAMERQRLKTSEWTSYYVVKLLAGFVPADRGEAALEGEPLGVRLVRALQADGAAQREALRAVGDASLFLAGFFSDSLNRRLVDSDYYIALGANAYGRLAGHDRDAFADVFGEIADKFVPLVDVLAEISDRASLGSNRELLRLYDRWLRTGSRRDEGLLAERGLVPNASISRRVQ